MSELSPELEDVLDRFLTNFREGGIEACRTMVADLEAQASLTSAVAGGVADVQHEMVQLQLSTSHDDLMAQRRMTDGISRDSMTALSQHSLALFLLREVEKTSRR